MISLPRRPRLVATDLDGTLLDPHHAVTRRTADALAAVREAGIEVVWATARARHSVLDLAATCGFDGLALCANGAVVLDVATGEVLAVRDLAAEVAREAMDRLRAHLPDVAFAAVGPTRFVAQPEYAAQCVFLDHHRDPRTMDRAAEPFAIGEPVVKIVARTSDRIGAELWAVVRDLDLPGAVLTHSGAPYVEIAAAGVSKAAALAAVCAERAVDAADVLAFGDAPNDLPMLAWAGTSAAPSGASPEVLAAVDVVLGSHADDAVAVALEGLLGD